MIRLVRILGFLMIGGGMLVVGTWAIPPLRAVWPWFRQLPAAIQWGLGVAAVGLLLLLASVLWERIEDREKDRSLRQDFP